MIRFYRGPGWIDTPDHMSTTDQSDIFQKLIRLQDLDVELGDEVRRRERAGHDHAELKARWHAVQNEIQEILKTN